MEYPDRRTSAGDVFALSRQVTDPLTDLPRWHARLEELWRCRLDEIVTVSLAYCEAAPPSEDLPDWVGQPSSGDPELERLRVRAGRAHEALTEIEDAIDRIKDGRFGICERCELPMGADWLAGAPQARHCPGCSLGRLIPRPAADSGGPLVGAAA